MIHQTLVRRLAKLGIDIELKANAPWVYLDKVNGTKVLAPFMGEHGFTAFFLCDGDHDPYCVTFSDRRKVFQKIRQILAYNQYVLLTQELGEYE